MLTPADHLRLILALLGLKGVGPVTARALASRVESIPEDLADLAGFLNELDRKPRGFTRVAEVELARSFDDAARTIQSCAAQGIGIAVEQSSPLWALVWSIPKPPAVLYFKGDLASAQQPGVAVVGTREPTDWGYASGERIAKRCCERGFTVVSGLAVGCDTSAHEGALSANGRTIAVLAHGLDSVYPAVNRRLADRILDSGGLLVSEYPPGTDLRANQLVERDRLQAGLSRAVIVVETDIKGGTMHTVGFAQAQSRKLAALAHPDRLLHEPKVQGNQELIRTGKAVPLPDSDALNVFLDTLAPVVAQPADVSPAIPQNLFDTGT